MKTGIFGQAGWLKGLGLAALGMAAVLAGSGGFIGSQLLLAWLFRSRLTATQWAGVTLVAIGSAVATLGGPVAGH